MSSNNYVIIFFAYIKMSKEPSAKYYQINKERLQEKLVKDIKVFLKKKKKRSDNMVVKDTKSEDEKQKLAEFRKQYYKLKKTPYYNYKKLLF